MDLKRRLISIAILVAAMAAFIVWFNSSPHLLPMDEESSFELSPDSSFPNWFSIPEGYTRKDVTVKIFYYSPPPLFKYNFKTYLIGPPPANTVLAIKIGTVRWHPSMSTKQLHPSFHIINVDGKQELVEHKKMEPVFYISDDPAMRRALESR